MFAVIQVGSMQYKVAEGDTIEALRLEDKEGINITLDKVLLLSDGSDVKVGQPYLKGVKVTAKVVRQHLGEKSIAFKYRKRKNSLWKKGHRPQLTTLNITKITAEK